MPHDHSTRRHEGRCDQGRPALLGAREPIFVSTASRPAPALLGAVLVAFVTSIGIAVALLVTGEKLLSWPAAAASLAAAALGAAALRRWSTAKWVDDPIGPTSQRRKAGDAGRKEDEWG